MQLLDRKANILAPARAVGGWFQKNRFISNLTYSGYYMKHPVDGSYGISFEGRANWGASTFILLIFIAEYVINKYTCGFLVKRVMEGRYEIFSDVGTVVLVMVALTACTYLVCTINNGEGTVKKIYTFFCYSLMPYIVITPITYLLSHVLTFNESIFINLLNILVYAWTAVIAFIGLKEVNNFKMNETVKVIFLTAFTALIMALLIFIIYVLWAQVFEFVSAIIGEAVYRIGY